MNRPDSKKKELFSIAELAEEFGISTRTIRFYESRGLIAPERVGNTRVFRRSDRARLILILRGKRLGFSLSEISDYLELYDVDPAQTAQTAHLGKRVGERIALLERQLADLQTTLAELRDIRKLAEAALTRTKRTVAKGWGRLSPDRAKTRS